MTMTMTMTRRSIFTAAAGLAGAAGASAGLLTNKPSALSDLALFTRIRCQPPGRRTFWWYSGLMLARRTGEALRPFVTVVGASQSDIIVNPDGSIIYSLIEAGYYGDIATDKIADKRIVNALTGEMVQPEHYLSPQKLRFLPDLSVRPEMANLPPGLEYHGRITPPDRKGDVIWMAEELFVSQPASAKRGVRISNSLANFQARATDLYSDKPFVPATMQYTTVNSLRPWMNMGATPGDVVMRLNAIKLANWSGVDEALRARIEHDHPGVFRDT